jgi:catechol 2,3-dioxygenase-like lactoylglutathione lyase family enzyme
MQGTVPEGCRDVILPMEDEPVRPPRARLSGPVLEGPDPVGLARFYEKLLGWDLVEVEGPAPDGPPDDGWARLMSPTGHLKIEFQWERNYVPPVWPSEPGSPTMMMHLDIAVENLEAGVRWAVRLGARVAEHQPQSDVRVMIDPAGHPFCMFAGSV